MIAKIELISLFFAKHNYKVIHIAQVRDCWIINLTLGLYENNYVFIDYEIKWSLIKNDLLSIFRQLGFDVSNRMWTFNV